MDGDSIGVSPLACCFYCTRFTLSGRALRCKASRYSLCLRSAAVTAMMRTSPRWDVPVAEAGKVSAVMRIKLTHLP